MPHVVIRLYTESGDLIRKIRENEAEVREIMLGVPGLRTYGLADTGTGAFSITTCEDKAGCDESTRRAGEWIRTNMPGAKIAPPRVIEGEGVFRILARVDESQPHIVLRLFSEPPPESIKNSEVEIRKLLSGVPGFRMHSVTDTGTGGINVILGDDKASTDECVRRMRDFSQKLGVAPTNPEVVEAEGVLRISTESVPV
jgi:hypothetical protein